MDCIHIALLRPLGPVHFACLKLCTLGPTSSCFSLCPSLLQPLLHSLLLPVGLLLSLCVSELAQCSSSSVWLISLKIHSCGLLHVVEHDGYFLPS